MDKNLVLGSPISFLVILGHIPVIARRIGNEEDVLGKAGVLLNNRHHPVKTSVMAGWCFMYSDDTDCSGGSGCYSSSHNEGW